MQDKSKKPLETQVVKCIKSLKKRSNIRTYNLYKQIKLKWEDDNAYWAIFKDKDEANLRAQLAWEYLRRNVDYYKLHKKLRPILSALRRKIRESPDNYSNDEELAKMCKSNLRTLRKIGKFGLNNPLYLRNPKTNSPPLFYPVKKKSNPSNMDGSIVNVFPQLKNNSAKPSLPNLYEILYNLRLISKQNLIKIKNQMQSPSLYVTAQFFLVQDTANQLSEIKKIIKKRRTKLNIDCSINKGLHIRYLRMIDAMLAMNDEDWRPEMNKIKDILGKGLKERAFYDSLEKAIAYSQGRHYLELINLGYLLDSENR